MLMASRSIPEVFNPVTRQNFLEKVTIFFGGGKAKKEFGLSSGPNDLSGFIRVELSLTLKKKNQSKKLFEMTKIFGGPKSMPS